MNTLSNTQPTTDHDSYDVVVIGAGPAGATAAYLAAKEGLATLLLEAKSFPRSKVCGGCLNARAVALLEKCGLAGALASCRPGWYEQLQLCYLGRTLSFPMPRGASVSRHAMDHAIVSAAQQQGVEFRDQTSATVLPITSPDYREVRLRDVTNQDRIVRARVVLACDGLGRPSLKGLTEFSHTTISAASRVGIGAVLPADQAGQTCPPGRIQMIVGRSGYVGLARCEDNRLSVAAAVDQQALAGADSAGHLLSDLFSSAGVSPPCPLTEISWRGTRPLTQKSLSLASGRVFLLGDSAGYVEPFTGEGMAAAVEGACCVIPFVRQACSGWSEQIAKDWRAEYTRRIRSRQGTVRTLSWLLRRRLAMRLAFGVVASSPQVGAAVAKLVAAKSQERKSRIA
ncbi:MAG: FAD-dependent monooxygenase [Planctomycetales bacterium]|nr:FAD-dependent monooxygenase [Planctomycetales bacterium]